MRAALRFVFFFGERLIIPSPPGVIALDVEQELRYWPPIRPQQTNHVPDTAICGLPLPRLVIEVFQAPEFVVEQRLDFCEPGSWPDFGVEPREIPARHHKLGKYFVTTDELPHAVGFTHGTDPAIRPVGGMRAHFRARP
jgi:hypothetical protein